MAFNFTTSTSGFRHIQFQEGMMQSLVPAVAQCFGTIVIGYIFARSKVLNQHGTKGLCLFLQYLCLPALIFTSLATITATNVKWSFVAAILVAKCIIFAAAAVATMVMTKPANLGKAGIYAIACTQSNDLGLGYPFMAALYKATHPTFPDILYVIVPIQLLILNPVGFFLMETYKRRSDPQYSEQHSICRTILSLLKNPIIIATLLGVIWNFAFNHYVPLFMNQLLQSIGGVFSPLSLFLLGHSMSCGFKAVKGHFSLTPAVIVVTKVLILPLVLQKITLFFLRNGNETEIQDFSSLGFLYGIIPCAPTVFIFAKQYDISVNIIATVTVYSTMVSMVLMIASATMISLTESGLQNVTLYLKDIVTYTSAISMSCCIVTLILFTVRKKWRDVCTVPVIYILFAQMFMCMGGVLFFLDSEKDVHLLNVQYILTLGGFFLMKFFAIFLGFLIFLLQRRSLCFVLQHNFLINTLGLTLPLGLAAILAFSLMQTTLDKSWNMDFQFSYIQVVVVLSVSVITLVITIVFLILQHRYMNVNNLEGGSGVTDDCQQLLNDEHTNHILPSGSGCSEEIEHRHATPNPSDIEDMAQEFEDIRCSIQKHNTHQRKFFKHTCDSQYNCNAERRLECSSQIEEYKDTVAVLEVDVNEHYIKHVILLLSFLISMIVHIMVCISWLRKKSSSGIGIELQFLDVILSYGQGILCFILFGVGEIFTVIRRCFNTRGQSLVINESNQERLVEQESH